MNGTLNGKVALVTGGSRGIGAATARGLAAEGADVAISYSTSASKAEALVDELRAKGVRAEAFQADQADPAQVDRLVKTVVERFGRLDILVNNAGVAAAAPVDHPINGSSELDRLYAVNVFGVVGAIRAAAQVMGEGGRIISIGSCLGAHTPFPCVANYSATTSAIVGYTRGAARDLGPKGITVNVVQPGPIDTEMNPADGATAPPQKAATAMGRYGRPEEVAAAVCFLARPEASYITGTALDVDGGFGA